MKEYTGTNSSLSLQADHAYELSHSYLRSPAVLKGTITESSLVELVGSLPMSPTATDITTMNREKLRENSERGQQLRLKLLRGAVMVFITAGYEGKRFIFERAKALGIRSVIIESPDSWARSLTSTGTVEKFVAVDMDDRENLMQNIVNELQTLTLEMGHIDGITTFCEMAVPLVSRLAQILNLPHNPVESIDIARDKHAFRTALTQANLPSPVSHSIKSAADLPAAAKAVGFPAVIKPVAGAASLGVVRVDSEDMLAKAYAQVIREMSSYKISSGALMMANGGGEEEEEEEGRGIRGGGNAGHWMDMTMMMEEYLDGEEVDVDIVLSDGKAVYGAITDNWPTIEPYFNETGSNAPSILPAYQQRELIELSVQALKALKFKLGVFHVEAKYTSRGARLIEINCRLGGGPVHLTNKLVWGVDLVEEHLMASAGIPVRPQIAERPLRCIAEYSINAPVTGMIKNDTFMNKWVGHANVLYARPLVKTGDRVVSKEDGMPTWLAEVMVNFPTVEEGIEFVKDLEAKMDVPIEKKR